jgi:hypothetical protein
MARGFSKPNGKKGKKSGGKGFRSNGSKFGKGKEKGKKKGKCRFDANVCLHLGKEKGKKKGKKKGKCRLEESSDQRVQGNVPEWPRCNQECALRACMQ